MKKNVVFNKYYRNLRKNIFPNIDIDDFMNVWENYKRLKRQYHLIKICDFIEKINIRYINIPLLHFLTKFLDFVRWKVFDIIWYLANGKYSTIDTVLPPP